MGACISRTEEGKNGDVLQHNGNAEEAAPYRRTASLSAFAAAATKKFAGAEPAVVEKQPRNKAHSCPAQSAASQQTCSEAAVLPHPGTAANRISPWAALDASAAPAATQGAQQPVAVPRAPEKLQRLPQGTFRTAYQEEHHAELLQLLEDACRDQQVDWKALRCSLQKSLSANTAAIDPVQPAQALMRNTPMSSGLSIVWTARHDSASSSIEVCRGNSGVPTTLRTPRVPALGKLGVAGSLPVHSYCKPVPAPSCPEFLRMLSSEARTAYREWRGDACEEDSCRVEDLDSACDAAICSLGSATTFGDWFEMGPIAKSQSLFYGSDAEVKSPFEYSIPETIQCALSNPNDSQPSLPRPRKPRRQSMPEGKFASPPPRHQSFGAVRAAAALALFARPPLPLAGANLASHHGLPLTTTSTRRA